MTKAEWIAQTRQTVGGTLTNQQVSDVLDAALQHLMTTLASGDVFRIFNLGSFSVKDRPPRTGRNPRSGEPIKIAASKGVLFRPSAALKRAIQPKPKAKSRARAGSAKKAGVV